MNQLECENAQLKVEVAHKDNEVSIVDWYLQIMECGKDSKQMAEIYQKEKKHLLKVQREQKDIIMQLQKENNSLKKQLKKVFDQLKKQQETVVRPLIQQLQQKTVEYQEENKEKVDIQKSLRICATVLRTPKLTDTFQKLEQQRMTAEKIVEDDTKAILALKQFGINDKNEVHFISNLINDIKI